MKKIKAIFCDFDGTIIDEYGQYFSKIKSQIKKFFDKNIRFSLATGRAYYSSVKKTEKELGIKGIHILHGGGMIYDSVNDKILFRQAISGESTTKIIQYLLTQELAFSLEAEDCVYMSKKVKENIFYPETTIQLITGLNSPEKILKILIFAEANRLTEPEMRLHIKNLQKSCSDISIIIFQMFNLFGADITSEKATKHTAVLEYLKMLNLTREEVVAIGNDYNDYPLFTACGFNIAMATAPKELKDIADLVVPAVKDGGIIEALEYIDKNLI